MNDPSSLRVADADREQLAQELREHMLAGRLSTTEFEERLERAYKASTRGEIEELKADLPMSPASLEVVLAKRRTQLRRRLSQEAGGAVGVSLLCVVIWLAGGAEDGFWPGYVVAFSLLPLLRNAWRLFGPAPDLEAVEAHLASRRRRRLGREHHRSHRHRPPGLPR